MKANCGRKAVKFTGRFAAPVILASMAALPGSAFAQQKVPPSAALQSCSVNNAVCQLDSYAGWFVGAAESARIEQFDATAMKPSVTVEERRSADGRTNVVVFKGANGKYLAVQPDRNWEANFVATSADDPAAQFIAVAALDSPQGQTFTSFKSLQNPDRFLRHQGFKLFAHPDAGTSLFRRDASWRVLNAVTINTESARQPASASAKEAVPSIARTQPALTKLSTAPERPDAARNGRVAFISSDGSAVFGSRSVFILRNIASGETILVPVLGNDAETRTEVYVRPGTYEVTPPAPSVNGYQSFFTSKVNTTRITVNAGANPALVDFGLSVRVAPVAMRTRMVGSDSVTLDWDALPDVSVQSYIMVRTDGDAQAASETAGTVVVRGAANTKMVTAKGLVPNRKYTFTLFSKASDGKALPVRSISVSTSRKSGVSESSYALAPNTIVADNLASLRLEPVSETSIRIALPANLKRGSHSSLPGVAAGSLAANGCVVGTPFLLPIDVAGDQSFYGVIDACEGPTTGATSAIVNRDVPLIDVFNYFKLDTGDENACYDGQTGALLPGGNAACAPVVNDSLASGGNATASQPIPPSAAAAAKGPALPFDSQTNLVRGQQYWSQSGKHYLVFQSDGNLVVYRADGGYVWGLDRQPGVNFQKIGRVTWQADGNLAAYAADNGYVWSALNQNPDSSARLVINAEGVLQIVAGNRVMWSASSPRSMRDDEKSGLLALVDRVSTSAAAFSGDTIGPVPDWADAAGVQMALAPDFNRFGMPFMLLGSSAPISCDKSGKSKFQLSPRLEPLKKFSLEVSYLELRWDIKAGVKASFNPQIEVDGNLSCALKLPEINIPIGGAAIPISLRLKPDVSLTAAASLKLAGPSISLDLGVQSKGKIYDEKYDCAWWRPCKHRIGVEKNTQPIASFKTGPASANLTGTLTFRAGVDANLGFGYSIGIAKARAGFSLVLSPLSAELKAQAGTNSCASASVGYQIDAALVGEVYLPLILDEEKRVPLYESGHKAYPGASFTVGDCGDDD